jgi:hypothetical protein
MENPNIIDKAIEQCNEGNLSKVKEASCKGLEWEYTWVKDTLEFITDLF